MLEKLVAALMRGAEISAKAMLLSAVYCSERKKPPISRMTKITSNGVRTPFEVIFVILLIGGFFRSLQYTALNSIAFADISAPRMSAATSFSSMVQQISNGMGVAFAAVALNLVLVSRGHSLTEIPLGDIALTLLVMAGVTLTSCFYFARLAPDAAAKVSG